MYKIAITGKANSGKNTVSKLLIDSLRHKINITGGNTWAESIAFADPIKKMIRTAYPEIPRKWLYGASKYRSQIIPGAFKDGVPLTVRQCLIDIGNDFGRRYKSDIWLRNFDHTYNKLIKKEVAIVMVTDCRFRNEFDHLKDLGFYQIRLYRNSHTKINDISETNQDSIKDSEFNYVVHNNSTLKFLEEEVKKIVMQLK